MAKVRVLQGCSILVDGIWHNQGAVLEVANPAAYTRTETDKDGKVTTLPCTEPAGAAPVNVPEGLLPKAVEAPGAATPDAPAATPAKPKEK